MPRFFRVSFLLSLVCLAASSYGLTSDQLLLITNRNNPDSRKLAEHYAKVRHVPDGRIVELSLPVTDEVTFDQYEREIVPAIQRFLTDNNLRQKVTCLVTFYGMPLRIARRPANEDDTRELGLLQTEISSTRAQIEPIVHDFEDLAKSLDPSFDPSMTWGNDDAAKRADRAAQVITRRLPVMNNSIARDEAFKSMTKIMERLAGPDTVALYMAKRELADKPDLSKADRDRWTAMISFVQHSRSQLQQLLAARYDSASRAKARTLARDQFGLIEYAAIVQRQLEYLKPGDTASSLDNELSLLWYDIYPRAAWLPNPLHYTAPHVPHAQALMTARLDAPDLATAERMLGDSLKAEQSGLTGRIVVDTRGLTDSSAYAKFDKHLLAFAELVKAHPPHDMDLFLDAKEEVLPPNSVENVALYAGWYSVGHYIPSCKFVPGAIAYHIASFEMVSIHNVGGYWVPHLLKDAGAAASLGAVAEPYLHSFPLPDEFFPLLMTGKLTLAECYWRTNPLVSWMIGLVGDPLYNPFANKPALNVSDLPVPLQAAIYAPINPSPSTQP